MKKIEMYSGPMCNFCEAAKRLLSRNKLNYEVIDISSSESLRDEMIYNSQSILDGVYSNKGLDYIIKFLKHLD